jgi:hypothetical protein
MQQFNSTSLQQLMREIRKTILDDIAEAMHNLGFIGGTKIDAGKLVGQVPIGSARFVVQHDGVQVGEATYILNFVGSSWIVTADPANNRINIGLAGVGGPDTIVDDSLNDVTDDAGNVLYLVGV